MTQVLGLTTQLSLKFYGIEEETEMTVDQLRYRTNSDKLREKGIYRHANISDIRQLAASAALQTFRALAGMEGATPFLKRQAQEMAIAKCMTGDMEGLLDLGGVNAEAFLDQVKKSFPDESPRPALIKFAKLVVARAESISVEEDRRRRRLAQSEYDEFF